jgi:hypothetical protein
MAASERGIAAAPGSHDMVQLDSASADLRHAGPGGTALDPSMSPLRSSWGPLGSSRRAVSPTADILSMRPGLAAMGGVLPVRGDARAATIAPDSDQLTYRPPPPSIVPVVALWTVVTPQADGERTFQRRG